MKIITTRSAGLIGVWLLAMASSTQAHSWVEQLTVIAPNGTFIGAPGFPRGNVLRTSPNFKGDPMSYLIPPNGRSTGNAILPTDLMCASNQNIGNQTPGSPALNAKAGDMVALRYLENGHVTIPDTQPGKPANRGTVFVYGTTKPSNSDTLLGIHRVWTADGKGGDGRGVLLATRNFDDGQCYQVNNNPISVQRQKQFPHSANSIMGVELWCQSDITLPSTIDTSSYTLYWVWDWPTAPGTVGLPNGKNETYTTCMDINISSGTGSSKAAIQFAQGQNLNSAAIESELSTPFIVSVTGGGAQPAAQTSAQPAAQSSSPQSKTTQAAAPARTTSANGGVVTVTQSIHDTVTIYTTGPSPVASHSSSSVVPLGESGGSIVVPASASVSRTSPAVAASTPAVHSTSSSSTPHAAASSTPATHSTSLSSTPTPPTGSIQVQPFHTSASNTVGGGSPTTFATQASKPAKVIWVTATAVIQDEVILTVTATPTASAAPKIRGRSPLPS